MRRKNIIAAVVLIVFAILYGVLTANLPVRTLPNTPDPSFFPWINTAIMLVLSVWLLVQGLKGPATARTPDGTGRSRRAVWALAAFVAYVAAMPGLGFILATAPFFAVMMVLFGERRPIWVGGGAVCTTVLLYALFRYGFGVFLPRGLLAGIVT
jgi:putative tricarboxylic transport membrane protein